MAWVIAWDSDFAGSGIAWASPGITGFMAGADFSYALSPTAGWSPRPRFNIAETRGTWEINRWAYAIDPNHTWPGGYTSVRPFGQAFISSGEMCVRAEPRPASLDGLLQTRTNSIQANGYAWSDTGVEYPWITAQPTTQHYVQVGGEWAVETRIKWTKGKASFPGIYLLATNFEHRLYEIDIVEHQGDEPNKSSFNIIVNGVGIGIGDWWYQDRGIGDTSTTYHTFRAEFIGGTIYAYVDGVLIGSYALGAIWSALDFYVIVQNQILDWDDQWVDGAGEAGGGAPNTSHATYPTQNPSNLLVNYIKVYKTDSGSTRLSGRAFDKGGSTAWLPPSIASTAPTVVMDRTNSRYYAYGKNVYERTLWVPRSALNGSNVGYDLVGPAGGAAFARRGLWAIKTKVPTSAGGAVLSVGDRWAYVFLSPTEIGAGIGGTEPNITHGLSAGADITILIYSGTDVNTKLWVTGGLNASGSYPSEYLGEHARVGVSTYGDNPSEHQPTLMAWYDVGTYPGDVAMGNLLNVFGVSAASGTDYEMTVTETLSIGENATKATAFVRSASESVSMGEVSLPVAYTLNNIKTVRGSSSRAKITGSR